MARTLVVGALLALSALLASCDDDQVSPEVPVGVASVRECLRVAGSFREDVPGAIQGTPKLNALVRRAKQGRGAVRTPPPDPTHTGSVVAYYLLFDDVPSARGAAETGREAVLEFRDRFRSSVNPNADYEMVVVKRNVLALYLQDPSDAEGQKEAIEDCIRDAPS